MALYKTLDDKPYQSAYLYHDAIIDSPVRELWPHVLNIGGWMAAHGLETIDGRPGEVGHFERVHPRGLAAGTPEPHYHLYGIAEIVPFKCVALEVFPEAGGSYGNSAKKTSFDTILLSDLGERTHLSFLMIDVLLQPREGDVLHAEDKQQRRERLRSLLDTYFDNLRRLVLRAREQAQDA
jgi:hypothetical protein